MDVTNAVFQAKESWSEAGWEVVAGKWYYQMPAEDICQPGFDTREEAERECLKYHEWLATMEGNCPNCQE